MTNGFFIPPPLKKVIAILPLSFLHIEMDVRIELKDIIQGVKSIHQ